MRAAMTNKNIIKALTCRQSGFICEPKNRMSNNWFGSNKEYVDNINIIAQMELSSNVGSLSFHPNGSMCLGASNCEVYIWDWLTRRKAFKMDHEHMFPIRDAKFFNLQGGFHFLTCCANEVKYTHFGDDIIIADKLISAPVGDYIRMACNSYEPQVFLTLGTHYIYRYDLRLHLDRHNNNILPNYKSLDHIDVNPVNHLQFIVSGPKNSVFLFDQRNLKTFAEVYYPGCENFAATLGGAKFSNNAQEILATYENCICLYKRHTKVGQYERKFEGISNPNGVTVAKFLGEQCKFIVCGSECGNLWFWDKNCKEPLNAKPSFEDEICLEVECHPTLPIIFTSGLEEYVQMWMPGCFKGTPFVFDFDEDFLYTT